MLTTSFLFCSNGVYYLYFAGRDGFGVTETVSHQAPGLTYSYNKFVLDNETNNSVFSAYEL